MNNSNGSCQPETGVPADNDSVEQELLPTGPMDRIASVDALRGLVILLMIFVNDVAGVKTAPAWLKHVSARADGMTLPDMVFPAFLFIMGMWSPQAQYCQNLTFFQVSDWEIRAQYSSPNLSIHFGQAAQGCVQ